MLEKLVQKYSQLRDKYTLDLLQARSRERTIAFLRALLFLIALALIITFIKTNAWLGIVLPLLLFAGFIYLVQKSSRIKARVVFLKNLIQVNEDELKAIKGDLSPFKSGNKYIDYHHTYSYDLDVFGEHSLYRLLDRTGTVPGRDQLAAELLDTELDREVILQRQKAVKELASELNWRQEFLATARQIEFEKDETRELQNWLRSKDYFLGKKIYPILFILIPLISVAIPVLIGFNIISIYSALYYILPLALVAIQAKRILSEQNKVGRFVKLFRKYYSLLLLLEKPGYKSEYLKKLQARLNHKGQVASNIVNQLSGILWGLESRNNLIMAFLLNAFMVWDLRYMVRLEIWRRDFGDEFDTWLDVTGRFEVLNSLANLNYNRDDMIFPDLPDGDCILEMESGGHPLIEPAKRIDNDLNFYGRGQIKIITGANMAGKSTLLRTVGINLLLGMMGAPVCAKKFTFTPIRIRTSVRTNDSLGDNESYFYAELVKLNRIMVDLRKEGPVFVIVDEMLKGTNSRDKHTGSVGLVKQLIKLGANGLVATHDIELGQLIREYPKQIENKSFEVKISDEHLSFDYILYDGISQNLNATFLMKQMGILGD
ncbi:MAG: hypothetical protein HOD37_03485 [Bacteroidetes bacterium]|nr:hypothetical protein [Bacteroidota bacterium]